MVALCKLHVNYFFVCIVHLWWFFFDCVSLFAFTSFLFYNMHFTCQLLSFLISWHLCHTHIDHRCMLCLCTNACQWKLQSTKLVYKHRYVFSSLRHNWSKKLGIFFHSVLYRWQFKCILCISYLCMYKNYLKLNRTSYLEGWGSPQVLNYEKSLLWRLPRLFKSFWPTMYCCCSKYFLLLIRR